MLVGLSHIVLESGRVGKKVSAIVERSLLARDDSAYARSTSRVQRDKKGNTKLKKVVWDWG